MDHPLLELRVEDLIVIDDKLVLDPTTPVAARPFKEAAFALFRDKAPLAVKAKAYATVKAYHALVLAGECDLNMFSLLAHAEPQTTETDLTKLTDLQILRLVSMESIEDFDYAAEHDPVLGSSTDSLDDLLAEAAKRESLNGYLRSVEAVAIGITAVIDMFEDCKETYLVF